MTARNTVANFHQQYIPEPNSGCWLWTGASPNGRYGAIKASGRRILAHVASYVLHRGALPAGYVLDHTCRNTFCVNPDHLEAVTQAVNSRRGVHATKTRCAHGHLYADGFEYYYRKDSGGIRYRRCLTCYRMRYPKTAKEGIKK